jgi:hypothetical protein
MNLFNLACTRGNSCQDIRNSLGVHMSPSGESCSMFRNPDTGAIIHEIERVVDGVEVEARATGECPVLDPAATEPATA